MFNSVHLLKKIKINDCIISILVELINELVNN